MQHGNTQNKHKGIQVGITGNRQLLAIGKRRQLPIPRQSGILGNRELLGIGNLRESAIAGNRSGNAGIVAGM